eukprot:gnl/MRDRNA2_/MRDRNA2_21887_c0_seq1.p1 gnl/MRDRNA2_/MRDRNA2_21887_c0~~gnl/MRDRNA2_/MRDRNA2_21887_c0_seq1.p1  ORF type:complete len:339 (-),score=51.96 gnl/MRDRNA2_/MRDRNA2_21887_c0_seq1:329-1246(-)
MPALEHMLRYMNLPTDVGQRLELNRKRREQGLEVHQKARDMLAKDAGKPGEIRYAADLIPLEVQNVNFRYTLLNSQTPRAKNEMSQLRNCSFQVKQGTMCAFVGKRGCGKTTLLNILGSVILPTQGDIFVPPHLRLYHISQEPLFVDGSLLENLRFGTDKDSFDASIERIVQICRRLALSDRVLSEIQSDATTAKNWYHVLSLTESILVHLARALIANPEVLVVHKPTLAFSDDTAQIVLRCFRRYVDEKGVDEDPSEIHHRRPRTCIFTASRHAGVDIADQVFVVGADGTFEVPKEKVTQEMFA